MTIQKKLLDSLKITRDVLGNEHMQNDSLSLENQDYYDKAIIFGLGNILIELEKMGFKNLPEGEILEEKLELNEEISNIIQIVKQEAKCLFKNTSVDNLDKSINNLNEILTNFYAPDEKLNNIAKEAAKVFKNKGKLLFSQGKECEGLTLLEKAENIFPSINGEKLCKFIILKIKIKAIFRKLLSTTSK